MNDKETIISLLNEFANPKKMASFFVDNSTPNFLFIRPSGNPIDAKGFEKMITGDIVQEKAEITKIHRFEFLSENIVMCIFTLGSKYTYKGTANDDLPTVTSIFKKSKKCLENSLDAKIYRKFWFIFMGLAKLISILMVLLLLGSSFIGLIFYFIK